MKGISKFLLSSVLVMAVLGLYILTLRGVPGNPVTSDIKNNLDKATMPLELSPERGRYALIMSLATRHSFNIGLDLAEAVYPDVGWHNGRYFVLFAPGVSLLAWPLYTIGSYFGLAQVASFLISSLFATGCAIMIYKISRRIFGLPVWASIFSSLAFCFGSVAWSYAITLYQHLITSFFILSGIFAVWKYNQKTKLSWIYASYVWAVYAIAFAVDYPNIIHLFPVMVYFGLSSISITQTVKSYKFSLRPTIIATSIVFLGLTFLHGYYNKYNFDDWTKLNGGLVDYKNIKEGNLLMTDSGRSEIKQIEDNKRPTKFFSEQDVPFGFYTLLWSDDRGLLLFSPLFTLAIFGVLANLKKLNFGQTVILANALTVLFVYSSWEDPWGGWAFGPRYLIPSLALISPFIGLWLVNTTKKITFYLKRVCAFLLFTYSSAVALAGALTTNAVPPTLDALLVKSHHNFLLNFEFLFANRSSSYIFKTFLKSYLSLPQYYLIILGSLLVVAYLILFILPIFQKHDH